MGRLGIHFVIVGLLVALGLEALALFDLANTVHSLARTQTSTAGADFGQFKQISKRLKRLEIGSATQTKTQETSQSQISALSQSIAKLRSVTAASEALKWRRRAVQLVCSFPGVTQTGSGTLFISDNNTGQPLVLTNGHVVTDDNGRYAAGCQLRMTELGETYNVTRADFAPGPVGSDLVFVVIVNPSAKVKANALPSSSICPAGIGPGESIIILGYPSVGAASSVTVTDGIISGYESGYYLTSAKVEHGHSGGTAVLISKDCYLGPPTFVEEGQLESLARILDVRSAGLAP